MQTYKQLFKAGVATSLAYRGSTFLIQSSDQGNSVEVDFTQNGAIAYRVKDVGSGFKARPVLGFDGVIVTATVDTNLEFIVTDGDIDLQVTQTSVSVTNSSANPVPVSLVSEPGAPVQVAAPVGQEVNVKVQGTVNVSGATLTATNVGIVPSSTGASDIAPVAVGNTGTALVAASAGRKSLRVRNAGPGQLGITAAAGTTFANAAVVLQVGDMWVETDAPQAAWYGVSDTSTTANMQAAA